MICEHVEAYCLMQYVDEVTGEIEVIWNSRDGVTPFGVTSRLGNSSTHIDWGRDIFQPFFVPNVGDRIFVDLTIEEAREKRKRYVDLYWDVSNEGVSMSDRWDSKADAIEELAQHDVDFGGGGSPSVVMVTEEMQEEFRERLRTMSPMLQRRQRPPMPRRFA